MIIIIEKAGNWPKTKKEPLWSLVTDYLRSPRTVTTHWLVAFQVSDVWFSLQLFRTGTASGSVSAAAAAVVTSAAGNLVPTTTDAFPSMYSALSSRQLCGNLSIIPTQLLQDLPLGSPAAGTLFEWDAVRPGRGCYGRPPLAIVAYRL